jgi:molybdate transport repressor ModE-like protein
MEPRSKFWIEKDGELVFSDWRVDLLEAIEETGSLSGAAERLGVHYRRAWGKIKEMEERLGVTLIVTQSGGVGGGGTELTPQAKEYIKRYRKFRAGLRELVDHRFKEAFEE